MRLKEISRVTGEFPGLLRRFPGGLREVPGFSLVCWRSGGVSKTGKSSTGKIPSMTVQHTHTH